MPLIPSTQPPYYTTQDGNTKVYRALITQSGTSAPTAEILTNTLGAVPVWTYDSVGNYLLTLLDAFPLSKTMWFIGNSMNGIIYITNMEGENNEILLLSTESPIGTPANGQLYHTPLEIIVYPEP